MRSLLISHVWPWGPSTGGRLRLGVAADVLATYGPVDVFVVTGVPDPGSVGPTAPFERTGGRVDRGVTGLRGWMLRVLLGPAAGWAVAAPGTRRALADWVGGRHYDLVWYCGEKVWLKTRGIVDAAAVIDLDDLNDGVLAQWLAIGRTGDDRPLGRWSRLGMRRDIRWWRSVHRRAARAAEIVTVASDVDRRRLGLANAMTLSNTYPRPARPGRRNRSTDAPTLVFQGLLTYLPNVDGARWLVAEILPLIRARLPQVCLILAGRATEEVARLAADPQIEVTGFVPDMATVLARADLVVVPLRVGGGTRIKILEAFAHRVPVVATTAGAHGLDVRGGEHLEIGDTPAAFADACVRLLADPVRAERLAAAAHDRYLERYQPEVARCQARRAAEAAVGAASRDPATALGRRPTRVGR